MTVAGDVLWLVEEAKLIAFLLNPEHRKGASRLKFLLAFGFSRDRPKQVADALVMHAFGNQPGKEQFALTGPRRVVFEGTVPAPDGRDMPLRTVWEIGQEGAQRTVRFLTAIPLTR